MKWYASAHLSNCKISTLFQNLALDVIDKLQLDDQIIFGENV